MNDAVCVVVCCGPFLLLAAAVIILLLNIIIIFLLFFFFYYYYYYCGVRDDISSTSKPELCNLVGPNLATIFDQCMYENEISSPMLKLLIDAELSSNEFA